MMTAAETFMAVANQSAALVAKAPAYVSYRVSGTVHFGRGESPVVRTVVVRTDDGRAVVRNETTGAEQIEDPFPASPAFDALSHFRLDGGWTVEGVREAATRDVDLRIVNVHPLRYIMQPSNADAVVRAVRDYKVSYGAPGEDGSAHLHLEPIMANFGKHRNAWLQDVWYDPVTLVPNRVVYGGFENFVLDARYETIGGVWLLHSLRVAEIFRPLAGLFRNEAWFEGTFADYRFSATAPDPRLAASGAASTGRADAIAAPRASTSTNLATSPGARNINEHTPSR